MKSILLFSCLIVFSYCTEMNLMHIHYRISLPTTLSVNKYFYFYRPNSDYSNYIYIYLEDNKFGLKYNNIKYCFTGADPSFNRDSVVNNCSFTTINYYSSQITSDINKYYYKIPTTSSYNYSIVYYDGSNSGGRFYVTVDYNELAKSNKMTQVSRNYKKTSLITSSSQSVFPAAVLLIAA